MRTVLVVLLLALGACGDKKTEPTGAATEGVTPPTGAADPPAEKEDTRAAPVSRTGQPLTLMARLTEEAKSRPTGTPSVEQVFKALDAEGIKLAQPPKQYLAATALASFCMGGTTEAGLGVAVCEYADEEAARKGREYSLEKFKAANPNRLIVVNKKTTLTLSTVAAADSDVVAKRAAAIFEKL